LSFGSRTSFVFGLIEDERYRGVLVNFDRAILIGLMGAIRGSGTVRGLTRDGVVGGVALKASVQTDERWKNK
jgi:hypothetical protein